MEASGNDFEPIEDENSIDDVSNKSIGVPDTKSDEEETKVEIDLQDDLIQLRSIAAIQSNISSIQVPEKTIDVDEPMDFLPKRLKF